MQSTHRAVRACKSFRLHHRRIVSAMEIRANSRQTLPQNNSCTNYKLQQEAVGMASPKTQTLRLCNQRTERYELANPSASTIAVLYRQWKFAQIPGKPYTRTIVALMQTTYEQEAVGMGSPKTQTLRLCNQRTERYELANRSASTIAVLYRQWKFAQIPGKPYTRTIVALMQTTYEQEAVGMGSPKTQTLRLCNQRTERYELANRSASTIAVLYRQWKFAQIPGKPYPRTIVAPITNYSKKLWEWGAQKRKPSVCANNAQSGRKLQIVPPPTSRYYIDNGNSRKFPANPTPEQ